MSLLDNVSSFIVILIVSTMFYGNEEVTLNNYGTIHAANLINNQGCKKLQT